MGASSVGGGGGDIHFDASALSGHTGRPGDTAVQMRNRGDQREAQARAALRRARAGGIGAIERLEQVRQIVPGDAGPRILDGEPQSAAPGNGCQLDADGSTQGSELQRVVEQMVDQTADELGIDQDRGLSGAQCPFDDEVAFLAAPAQPVEPVANQSFDVGGDAGEPLVLAEPDSASARAIVEIAEAIGARQRGLKLLPVLS